MARIGILGHRGWWRRTEERNTLKAMERCFAAGFGVETDLRDHGGGLVVSHDPPDAGAPAWAEVLALWDRHGRPGTLALNIKADGLQKRIGEAMAGIGRDRYFVFDMSVPDTAGYLHDGLPVFVRHSEHEPVPAFYERADGIWLDAFEGEWTTAETFDAHIRAGKRLALVSPELHGRPHRMVWARWRSWLAGSDADILLCTDFPDQAKDAFNG
ncbi:hypothetical protein HW532_05745 [Kaustia mangrovi]|uniref:Phosphodiesterase n=1 Tax=Kaustia mangrovi TaxID=2593653 RepID=A0A7S8C2N7_9HYPH|nr:hypothetical protein [Kaustia mangrovi]QPC42248.1 hypothetical protein HW532_05745 [Kaustia mangrovi]